MTKVFFGLLGVIVLIAISTTTSCTSDELPEPMPLAVCDTVEATYTADLKEVIDRSCAYSGCHVDASIGNFLSFKDMLPYLKDGSMRQRVINLRDDPIEGMPPNYAPSNRPQQLTPAELTAFECWLEAGFPE